MSPVSRRRGRRRRQRQSTAHSSEAGARAQDVFSCRAGHKIVFSAWSVTRAFKRRSIGAECRLVTVLMRWVRGHRGGVIAARQSRNAPEIPEGSTLPDRREVIMIMSGYEERFRSPTPSLHQIFAEARGP